MQHQGFYIIPFFKNSKPNTSDQLISYCHFIISVVYHSCSLPRNLFHSLSFIISCMSTLVLMTDWILLGMMTVFHKHLILHRNKPEPTMWVMLSYKKHKPWIQTHLIEICLSSMFFRQCVCCLDYVHMFVTFFPAFHYCGVGCAHRALVWHLRDSVIPVLHPTWCYCRFCLLKVWKRLCHIIVRFFSI